ncbi:hypothetical protein ABZ318_28700 [Streptomyces sp. NPDC006197]|uniref:hypothetical protein n=1 Tax=Streptomyces sp. NPDC006197 TaxID=3156685 RepID=UPI0033B3E301
MDDAVEAVTLFTSSRASRAAAVPGPHTARGPEGALDVYPRTLAGLPLLFSMAGDPATPDRAAVVTLLLSIGREAVERTDFHDGIVHGLDGSESTAYSDTVALMRERGEVFVSYAQDP